MFLSLAGFCSIPPSPGSNTLHRVSSPRGQIRIRHTRRALLSAPCLLPSPLLRVSPHHRPLSLAPPASTSLAASGSGLVASQISAVVASPPAPALASRSSLARTPPFASASGRAPPRTASPACSPTCDSRLKISPPAASPTACPPTCPERVQRREPWRRRPPLLSTHNCHTSCSMTR